MPAILCDALVVDRVLTLPGHSNAVSQKNSQIYVGLVPKYYAAIRLTFNLLRQKLVHRLLLSWRTTTPISAFLRVFVFELESVRDGRTDGGRTGKTGIRASRPHDRTSNSCAFVCQILTDVYRPLLSETAM